MSYVTNNPNPKIGLGLGIGLGIGIGLTSITLCWPLLARTDVQAVWRCRVQRGQSSALIAHGGESLGADEGSEEALKKCALPSDQPQYFLLTCQVPV